MENVKARLREQLKSFFTNSGIEQRLKRKLSLNEDELKKEKRCAARLANNSNLSIKFQFSDESPKKGLSPDKHKKNRKKVLNPAHSVLPDISRA